VKTIVPDEWDLAGGDRRGQAAHHGLADPVPALAFGIAVLVHPDRKIGGQNEGPGPSTKETLADGGEDRVAGGWGGGAGHPAAGGY
jgi:hypothetical protein